MDAYKADQVPCAIDSWLSWCGCGGQGRRRHSEIFPSLGQ